MKAKINKRLRPLRFLQKYGRLLIGGTIIAVVLFGAIFAPLLTDYEKPLVSLCGVFSCSLSSFSFSLRMIICINRMKRRVMLFGVGQSCDFQNESALSCFIET